MCEISSKLTVKVPDQRYWRRSAIFIVSFECIVDFEQVNAGWVIFNDG